MRGAGEAEVTELIIRFQHTKVWLGVNKMQTINYGGVLVGFFFILLGLLIFIRSYKWVNMLIETWPLREFSAFEIKLMKIGWKIAAIFFIIFGGWIIIKDFFL